jgi:rRNA maturation endonuclease Nob1
MILFVTIILHNTNGNKAELSTHFQENVVRSQIKQLKKFPRRCTGSRREFCPDVDFDFCNIF